MMVGPVGDDIISINPVAPARTPSAPRPSNNMLGLGYMAGGMFIYAAVDAQAKFLTETLHPLQVVWSRQWGLLLGILIYISIKGISVLRTHNPTLQITRGILAAGSASLFIIGISFVSLADAVAVSFVAPLIVTILGALILREPVGVRRWTAVIAGFIGTLIVVRPGLGVVHPAVLFVVAAAALFALRQIVSRSLSNSDSTATTVAYTAIVSITILTVPIPFVWQSPATITEWMLLGSMAAMAACGEILVIKALEAAHAVVVAPVQYTLIIWGTMYGYLIFGNLPDIWTWVGALIIVATGFYTLQRGQVIASKNPSRG